MGHPKSNLHDECLHLQTIQISSPQMINYQVANLERSNKAVVERLKRVEGEVEKKGEFHKNCNCNRLDWNTVVASLGDLDQHSTYVTVCGNSNISATFPFHPCVYPVQELIRTMMTYHRGLKR